MAPRYREGWFRSGEPVMSVTFGDSNATYPLQIMNSTSIRGIGGYRSR